MDEITKIIMEAGPESDVTEKAGFITPGEYEFNGDKVEYHIQGLYPVINGIPIMDNFYPVFINLENSLLIVDGKENWKFMINHNSEFKKVPSNRVHIKWIIA